MEKINMEDLKNKSIKIENFEATVTSGDLINIIQHSVTRDDMENLRKEFKVDFNKLDTKIDSVAEKLDTKIDKLNTKIDTNFKWIAGLIIAGILIPIATHFLTLP